MRPTPPSLPTDNPLFEAVFAQTSDVVLVLYPDATIASCLGESRLGYRVGELDGRDAFEIVETRNLEETRKRFERLIDDGEPSRFHLLVRHADDALRWHDVTTTRYLDKDGVPWAVLIARDIHRHKTEELAVRESEHRYRALVEQSPFGILIVDGELNVIMANEAYAKQVGAPDLEALRGHNLMMSPAVDSNMVEPIVARLRAGESISTSLSYESLYGKQVDVRVNISPAVDPQGDFVAAQMIFEDVSESRRLEEQLRQSQKMEAVGRLAGGMAHDFNNNLTVILGLAEILAESADGEESRGAANEIVLAAERSAALTTQLLAFSRTDKSRLSAVDLNRIVTDLETMLRRMLGETIELAVSVGPEPLAIKANARLLEQVILNLAINARDAMPNGGTLGLDVSGDEDGNVVLRVHDDGIGMDDETKALSLEPFFTTKSEGQGTGLGLSTAYGVVSQFGGTLDLESTLGEGTHVSVRFPRVDHVEDIQEGHQKGLIEVKPSHRREVILLIEDQSAVRKFLRRTLEGQGYDVVEATDGAEAIERGLGVNPRVDLVLSDVRLPDTSGPEAVAKLRAQRPELRALYISGYNDLPRDTHGRLSDGFELIDKPFTARHLLNRIRATLDEQTDLEATR